MSRRIEFFKSAQVGGSWRQGIHLRRARWHSCMQWGWPAINSGERLARWSDYLVLTVCWRTYGACWHWYPRAIHS